ncbi:MAG: HIT family protein [Candidatus Thermoplasmatota archaeon]|nr:HIT family protein [Candidatus Thermoplasmatota archaeon]
MSDCIFCKIIQGEIPSNKVYEDDHVFAFLDINPLTNGHTLVVPKVHAARIGELTGEQAAAYFREVPAITQAVEAAVEADGATLAWNDGEAAGQEVPHAHLHIVPRWDGDGYGPIHALFGGPGQAEGLDKVQEAVQAALDR